VNLFWITVLSDSLDSALSLLCKAKPPFRVCDKFVLLDLNSLCNVTEARSDKKLKAGNTKTGDCFVSLLSNFCERLKDRAGALVVVGSKAVGIATKHGDGYRVILTTDWGLYFLTYAPSKEVVVTGEVCSTVGKVAGGECPRLKYEVWCRWCNAPDGRRYRRCWADVVTNSEGVKKRLAQLKLHDIDERELDATLKTLSSICS